MMLSPILLGCWCGEREYYCRIEDLTYRQTMLRMAIQTRVIGFDKVRVLLRLPLVECPGSGHCWKTSWSWQANEITQIHRFQPRDVSASTLLLQSKRTGNFACFSLWCLVRLLNRWSFWGTRPMIFFAPQSFLRSDETCLTLHEKKRKKPGRNPRLVFFFGRLILLLSSVYIVDSGKTSFQ